MRISACIGGWQIGGERATLIEELSVELQMLAWRSAMSGSDEGRIEIRSDSGDDEEGAAQLQLLCLMVMRCTDPAPKFYPALSSPRPGLEVLPQN